MRPIWLPIAALLSSPSPARSRLRLAPLADRHGRDLSRRPARRPGRDPDRPLGRAAHLRRSEDDLFLAQGWNAARDRLWQLDLWKRRGDGTLAEAFGPEYVAKDRAARLLLYRGDLRDEWIAYAGDTKRIVSSFVGRHQRLCGAHRRAGRSAATRVPGRSTTGRRAGRRRRWCAIRSHGLLRNAKAELKRAIFLRRFGASALALRDHYEPEHELEVPEGLDLAALRRRHARRLRPRNRRGVVRRAARRGRRPPTPRARARRAATTGRSPPSRTTTGRPILANDPHRALELPSLRYLVHLSSPRLELAGAGEPALPGRLARPQRARRVRVHHLRAWTRRTSTCCSTRGRAGGTARVPRRRRLGAHDRGARARRGARRCRGGARSCCDSRATARCSPRIRRAEWRSRCARRGSSRGWRPIWRVSSCSAFATGTASSPRSTAGACRARTWSMPTPTGTIGWKPAGRVPIRAGLGRAAAGARRRPLRVDRLPRRRRAAGRVEPGAWLGGDRQPDEPAAGIPAARSRYEWAPPLPLRAHRGGALGARASGASRTRRACRPTTCRCRRGGWSKRLRRPRRSQRRRAPRARLLRDWDGRLDAGERRRRAVRGLAAPAPAGRGVGAGGPRRSLDADAAHELESATVPALLRGARVAAPLPAEEVTAALLESLAAAAAEVEERLGADWTRVAVGRRCTTAASTIRWRLRSARELGIETDDRTAAARRKRRHAGRHHLRASRLPAAIGRERARGDRRRRLGRLAWR